ncbi:hypothetical protein KUTeg_013425 [Tegillarca granosa]|uniref:Uncharacterized protein n=1 Tax=Tegillarca granosa TaxID=220873 RepID=A0ABQ9EW33_TEGGR|nr:hypothetical protein KUTeg_013425 [Tegillarca granosa]
MDSSHSSSVFEEECCQSDITSCSTPTHSMPAEDNVFIQLPPSNLVDLMEEEKPLLPGVTVRAATPERLVHLCVESFGEEDINLAMKPLPVQRLNVTIYLPTKIVKYSNIKPKSVMPSVEKNFPMFKKMTLSFNQKSLYYKGLYLKKNIIHIYLFIYLFIYYLFIYSFIHSFIHSFIYLFIYLFIY